MFKPFTHKAIRPFAGVKRKLSSLLTAVGLMVAGSTIANATIDNTVVVTGFDGAVQVQTSAQENVDVVNANPVLTLTKTGVLDDGADNIINAGDTITYSFTVKNDGNVTLNNINVTDAPLTMSGAVIATLAPGASAVNHFTATYTITQADINAGQFVNTATASAQTVPGAHVTDQDTFTVPLPSPGIALLKTVSGLNDTNNNGRADAGEVMTYGFTLRNTGNVTLTNVVVSDLTATVSGAPITLAAGAINTNTFTATKTISQADIDAGFMDNQASVVGTPPNGLPNVTDQSHPTDPLNNAPTRTTLSPAPAMTLVKAGVLDDGADNIINAGDTINYTFTVANTGNVTLSNLTLTDTLVSVAGGPIASLSPSTSDATTFSASYQITQNDIDNGEVLNTATVNAFTPTGGQINANSAITTPLAGSSALSLLKEATPNFGVDGRPDVGDTITYQFTLSNNGTRTIRNITITDPIVSVSGGPLLSALPPNTSDSITFSATYALQQADINAGEVQNQATARGTTVQGPVVDPSDPSNPAGDLPTIVALPRQPGIALVKTISSISDTNTSGITDAGDVINYAFEVTNTGNVTLTNVGVTDPLVAVVGANITLQPGDTNANNFSASHIITTGDMNAGFYQNQAIVSGTPPVGQPITDASDESDILGNDPTRVSLLPEPRIAILKTVTTIADTNNNQMVDGGDTIVYGFTVRNTGNVTLTNVTVSDPQAVLAGGPIASLNPGAADSTTFSATRVLTPADVNAGFVDNQATATGTPPTGPGDNVTDLSHPTGLFSDGPTRATIPAVPALELTKTFSTILDSNGNSRTDVGDTVTYTFTVANTGNVTLTSVLVSDPQASVIGVPVALNAGQTNTNTFTASHVLTQAEIDAGQFVNTASVSGNAPNGATPTDTAQATATFTPASSITLDKAGVLVAGSNSQADVGDVINYTFTVTNTGDTTLRNVRMSDPLLASLEVQANNTNMIAAIDPDAELEADPIMTASISGAASNAAYEALSRRAMRNITVSGRPMNVNGTSALIPNEPAAMHVVMKPYILQGDPSAPKFGDEFAVVLEVNNYGTIPLTNINAAVNGSKTFGGDILVVAPNEVNKDSLIFVRRLSAEDVAAGAVKMPAIITAMARDAEIAVVTEETFKLAGLTPLETPATASITPSSLPSLAPGQSTTFNASLSLTQSMIDDGSVDNTATVFGDAPSGTIDATDSVNVPTPAVPRLTVVKNATPNFGTDGIANVGDTIRYTFTVANTGNVTVDNITINDPLVTVPGGPISLAPGAADTTTFAVNYVLTLNDVNAGRVQNQATVNGRTPNDDPVQDLSDPSVPTSDNPTISLLPANPRISIVKQFVSFVDANNNGRTDVNDRATYRFIVSNTGNVTMNNVSVTDTLGTVTGGPIVLAPSATDQTTFTATVVLTQPMIDAGEVQNQATVNGTPPVGPAITDRSHPTLPTADAPTITVVPQVPSIAVVKTTSSITDNNNNTVTDLGDTINYAFVVTNTGNVTLNGITLIDANAQVAGGPIPSLAPGAVNNTTFTATHVITSGDVAAGRVVNQARVQARTALNTLTSDVSDNADINQNDPTITPIIVQPAIAVIKTVSSTTDTNGSTITDAGDTINFAFQVQNTGNVTLTNVRLNDLLPGAVVNGGNIPTLLAGDTDETTFTATYVITAADVTRGTVLNQAEVTATGPGGNDVTDFSDNGSFNENDPTEVMVAIVPRVALVKTVSGVTDTNNNNIHDIGDVINYEFTIINTGNAVLTNIIVTDTNAVVQGGPLATLNIGSVNTKTFTAQHIITLADMNNGHVENQAEVQATYGPTLRIYTDASDDRLASENDPTITPLVASPQISLIKKISGVRDNNENGLNDVGDVILYTFTVINTGNVTLNGVSISDPVTATSDGATIIGGPIATLDPGQSNSTIRGEHPISVADGEKGTVVNSATATGTTPTSVVISDVSDSADITGADPTDMGVMLTPPGLTKTANRSEVRRGEAITYTIRATNLVNNSFVIRDIMPGGFTYVDGSATANGVSVNPSVSGRTLTFTGLSRDVVKSLMEIKLQLRASVTQATGKFVNNAEVLNSITGALMAKAQATVTISAEHVFDCGDVIGKVFNDLNGNGYPDEGEPGLAAARIITVKGLIITTDKHGRFNVPCAALPDPSIGSNFILKLDPKSLPTGFKVTTENPRVLRLTRGKVTKFNFGATGTHAVQLDVTRDAFVGNSTDLKPTWSKGVDRLITILEKSRGDLVITYRCGQYAPLADQRVEELEAYIKSKWHDAGAPHRLNVKSNVECTK